MLPNEPAADPENSLQDTDDDLSSTQAQRKSASNGHHEHIIPNSIIRVQAERRFSENGNSLSLHLEHDQTGGTEDEELQPLKCTGMINTSNGDGSELSDDECEECVEKLTVNSPNDEQSTTHLNVANCSDDTDNNVQLEIIPKVGADVEKYCSVKTIYYGLWARAIMSRKRLKALVALVHVVYPAAESRERLTRHKDARS
ncbi:hypothetical protein ACROYT_G015947 [Oculina patagonica]